MPAAKAQTSKVYDVLHDFHTRIDDETGEEGLFSPDPAGHPSAANDPSEHASAVFDPSLIRRPAAEVEKLVALLLKGFDYHGPLIAEQTPAAAPAASEGN